jgi:hypothetical protein
MADDTVPRELAVEDIVVDKKYGTPVRRRIRVFLRANPNAASSATNLATYVPGVVGIENVIARLNDGAYSLLVGSAISTSTSTITYGSAGTVDCEITAFMNY